ncbi:dihydrofolate synthase / folylpolyglutamate synthase [Marinobacterium lutimaris]|uniref:Dihydrofolate synthase/folylpolyglutamate synthase n=2 Tax=Marinobacterium lutimaris TaxID=568106 RepID=A0A1H5UR21_9GAMM|nr:dihydrofolate synthase / folylpolyglutamate synthase [Marinobacterium lutimaris]
MYADFPDTLDAWLERIEACHPSEIDLGLERIRQVAERLELKLDRSRVVTVAGTNGKGSTVTLLDAILRQAGYTTGVYTSPHFLRYNERIRINGAEASDAGICEAFVRIEQARGDISLTYFEYGTLAALICFEQASPDVLLLEVGLGGRLDAVNIVDSDVAVITSIAIDHADWLGDDREQIGREKAGVLRAGKPLVCGDPNPPVSVRESAAAGKAQLLVKGEEFSYGATGGAWSWRGVDREGGALEYTDLVLPELPLTNAATVLQVLSLLKLDVSPEQICAGLAAARMTGRMQRLELADTDSPCVLDVAHNPEAAGYLANWMADHPVAGKTHLVLGMLADKDIAAVMELLAPQVDIWHLASLVGARAASSAQLRALLPAGQEFVCYDDVETALLCAKNALLSGDRLVVAGSFFTVSDALAALKLEG